VTSVGFEVRPCNPAIDVLTENSIPVSDSNPTAVSASVFAFPERVIVSAVDIVVEARNFWNAVCWSPKTVNGAFENVKWMIRCCTSVVTVSLGISNSANDVPPAETLMFDSSALISTGRLNGRVNATVESLLLVAGSYAVPSVKSNSSSLSSIDLMMPSSPRLGRTVSTTRLLIASFSHET
jgi:hypothetical protein